MSRLYIWAEYLQSSFGMGTRFAQEGSDDWEQAKFHCPIEQFNGLYYPGFNLAVINHKLYGTGQGFRTLIHEFGHHLCYTGQLTYKGNAFVRRYFREIDFKRRFHAYDKWALEEEMVVDCLAQWAVDWDDNHEVNKGFKDFLIQLGGAPPPF